MDNLDFNYFCRHCTKDDTYKKANCFTKYKVRHYQVGENITYKGQVASELSIVVTGEVTTEIVLDSGLAFTSRAHSSPYPLGALAIFAEQNLYRADIVARAPCAVISVSKENIENQMAECRVFMQSYIAYITQKIDVFSNHLNTLTFKSLKAKLAFYILSISKNNNYQLDKKIDALATYLCVERPSLSRVIAQFTEQGLITYNRGKGKILDANALKNMLS